MKKVDPPYVVEARDQMREKVHALILRELEKCPLTLAETARRVGITKLTAATRLGELEKEGVIRSSRQGQVKVFFFPAEYRGAKPDGLAEMNAKRVSVRKAAK